MSTSEAGNRSTVSGARGLISLFFGALASAGVLPATQVAAQVPVTDADFVHIQPGTFRMGDATAGEHNGPVHLVTLTRGFYLQKTELTQAQWQSVMGSNPGGTFVGCPACPVANVSYREVQDFIAELNYRSPGKKYRLPTEAEWEYAARAGTTGDYGTPGAVTFGGWFLENSEKKPHPVGGMRPNAWGLYDMHGNVWEWVNDWMGGYPSAAVTDPTMADTSAMTYTKEVGARPDSFRVMRGGSYSMPAAIARSAFRLYGEQDFKNDWLGFRLARTE